MKKLIASLLITMSLATPALAGGHHGYNGANTFVPFVAGSLFGYVVAQPRPVYVYPQPQVIYQQPAPVYVYPQNAPTFSVPQAGIVCELKSEMINGQIVQGNFCYNR